MRVINDEVEFCWTAVCCLDPEYEQYCMNFHVEEQKHYYDEDEPIYSLVTEASEVTVPRFRQAFGVDYTEEELEILNQVSSKKCESPVAEDEIQELQPDQSKTLDEFQNKRKDRDLWSRRMVLQEQYSNNLWKGNPNVLALPIPVSILAKNSSFFRGEFEYEVDKYKNSENLKWTNITRTGVYVRERDGSPQIAHDHFTGNRQFGFWRRNRREQKRIIYNLKRRTLYLYTVTNGKKHLLCLNYSQLNKPGYGNKHDTRFVQMMVDIVKRDVPDVYLLRDDHENVVMSFLALQHRYGKSIPWMTMEIWNKFCEVISQKPFISDTTNGFGMDSKPTKSEYSRRWRKFHKIFKKDTTFKGLLKAVFQEGYSKSTHFLYDKLQTSTTISIYRSMNKNGKHDNLHHFMLEVFRTYPKLQFKRNYPDTPGYGWGDAIAEYEFMQVLDNVATHKDVIDLWIRLCRRFIKELGCGVDWGMFRDMFMMATNYNMRIRINKFESPRDVKDMHDKLVEIMNRDDDVLNPHSATFGAFDYKVILPFEHPQNEYSGFKFVHLNSAEKLVDEGRKMHHCVGGYSGHCIEGTSLIFSMRKEDRGYVTLELSGSDYHIIQQYTIGDNTIVNPEFAKIIKKWQKDVVKMHNGEKETYHAKAQRLKLEAKTKFEEGNMDSNDSVPLTQPQLADDFPY